MAYQPFSYKLLGSLIGANMNTTSDQVIAMLSTRYYIDKVIVANASVSLTLAVGGLYTAASKGGSLVLGSAQAYSGLTGSTKILSVASLLTSDTLTASTLYLSLTTGQGSAATADWYIYGFELK